MSVQTEMLTVINLYIIVVLIFVKNLNRYQLRKKIHDYLTRQNNIFVSSCMLYKTMSYLTNVDVKLCNRLP